MIKIDSLKKSFGDFCAVDGVSFSVSPGEVLGFLGPNGAGKSTTMKMITGFIRPSSGQVSIFGHDVEKDSISARALVGYLPEGAPAYGDMTVAHYLAFIADIRGLKGEEKKQCIEKALEQLTLKSVLDRPIDNLSKGFKRRVGIAQAILHDPDVLILDEPTDGLDPNQKHQVRELIRNLSEEKIVVISTHILEEVTAVCTRAMIISSGRIVADSTPAELERRSRYHHAVTIEIKGGDGLRDQLADMAGVCDVEVHSEKPERYTLLPDSGAELFQEVNKLAVEKGWAVNELFVENGRLDDVFRTLTDEIQPAANTAQQEG